APGDRGRNLGVLDLELRLVDRGLVALDRPARLVDRGAHRVDLLLRDRELARLLVLRLLEALQVELGVLELRLVARELALRLLELDLEGPRVDLEEDLILLDELPLLEADLLELAVHPRADRDGVECRHRPRGREVDLEVALLRRRHDDRRRAPRLRGGGLFTVGPGAAARAERDGEDADLRGGALSDS